VIFDKVTDKNKLASFLWPVVYIQEFICLLATHPPLSCINIH